MSLSLFVDYIFIGGDSRIEGDRTRWARLLDYTPLMVRVESCLTFWFKIRKDHILRVNLDRRRDSNETPEIETIWDVYGGTLPDSLELT